MVMKKASNGDSPLRKGAGEELLDPPDLASMTVAACSMFSRKLIGFLGFSHRGEYIGGRAMSGGGPGAHTMPRCGQGVARAMGVWPPSGPPPSLLWTPSRIRKRNFGFCFVQFREYFLCNFSKTAENGELTLWHLVNRLVPENS
jgi:hypothetical protein